MDTTRLDTQVETIRQAFSYVTRFRDRLFVVQVADSLVDHATLPLLVRDLVLLHRMGIRVALVPGARSHIDRLLSTFGITCRTHRGVRISPPEAMQYIKMATSDVANRFMNLLAENDASAVVGNWVKARPVGVRDGIDFQSTGLVDTIQRDLVVKTLDDGLIPIFPNVGWGARGKPYNISSTELALTVSHELGAAKLFYLTDRPRLSPESLSVPSGVDRAEDGAVAGMTVAQASEMLELNSSRRYRRDLALLSRAVEACQRGVLRAHIVDGRTEGALLKEIFSNRGIGTMVYANEHTNIRPMERGDIAAVLHIMAPSVGKGILIDRDADLLEQHLDDYVVYEIDGTVHGCAALHRLTPKQAEVAALVVDQNYASMGIGRGLVSCLLDRARSKGYRRVFVLTTHSSDWFTKLGFTDADVRALPRARRGRYNSRRRSRVLVCDVQQTQAADRLGV